MELNQAPRTRARPNNTDVATASRSAIKEEDNDVDETYQPRPQLPKPLKLMRGLAELMSG